MKLLTTYQLCIALLLSCLSHSSLAASESDTIFPLRSMYSSVTTISHQELAKKIDDVLIIDVRSRYEYSVLHIHNAINVPLANLGFIPTLKVLRANDDRDIVFYCNGITCKKSYKANVEAQKHGVTKIFTFDLGVLNWAKLHPDQSVFFSHSPLDVSHLIQPEKFRQHLLLPKDFIIKIQSDSLLIDIREPYQKEQLIFEKNSISAPLHKFHRTLELIKASKATVLIYDAVGKQVRWLQYLLEKHNIKNYYFMQGGVKAYLAAELTEPELK